MSETNKKVFKAKDFEGFFKDANGLEAMLELLMKDYNSFFDNLIGALETDLVMRKFDEAKDLGGQLEIILSDANITSKKSTSIWGAVFGVDKPKNNMMSIKAKAEKIIAVYNDCYEALKKSVAMQVAKGKVMDEFQQYFSDVRDYVEKRLETLPQENHNEKIMYALTSNFLVNLRKMIITMEQKMAVMTGTIMNSMELKSEMSQNKFYFEGLIKDLLISISLDNIVNAASSVVSMFRGSIEKWNEKLANNMIKSANDVADIKKHGIVSIESMQDMGIIITAAANQYKALGQQFASHRALEDKAMDNMKTGSDQLKEAQGVYLTYNTPKKDV